MRPWPLLLLALALANPSAAAEPVPELIEHPNWDRIPSGADVVHFYPQGAMRAGINGTTRVGCMVQADGSLAGCRILVEAPENKGFGNAGLQMSKVFRMAKLDKDGQPTAGRRVNVPVIFRVSPGAENIQLLKAVPWSKTPTPAQVVAVFPKQEKAPRIDLTLRCRISGRGGLSDCRVTQSEPKSRAAEAAALTLAPLFEVSGGAEAENLPMNLFIDIPIALTSPDAPRSPLELKQATWMATPGPEDLRAAFPPNAREAKITTGRAVLDCRADHAGYLTNCASVEETPQGLGFGPAAVALAAKMRLNPWTATGFPTDGAMVRLPLRLTDDTASSPPTP